MDLVPNDATAGGIDARCGGTAGKERALKPPLDDSGFV
jgi:hypothetical protein